MLAIDFVGVQDKDQLDAYLMNLYEVDETPEEMTTGGTGHSRLPRRNGAK